MATSRGRRILITGMGSQLGSLVARELERQPWVDSVVGLDTDPPRRRLDRAEFHRLDPGDVIGTASLIRAVDPHTIVHLGVWEPDARANPRNAEVLTQQSAESVFSAAKRTSSLQHVVLRSGIEVYGRSGDRPKFPDESTAMRPTSQYGRMLMYLEHAADRAFNGTSVRVTSLRLAPVVGPHVPSPLGRLLRLPFVPFNLLRPPLFSLLHENDAAQAFVLATRDTPGTPVNVVADGSVSGFATVRTGRKVPLPLVGPEWVITRRIAHLFGAPIPEHVMEVLHHGRQATSNRIDELLAWHPEMTTHEILSSLYSWEGVVRVAPKREWEVAS
ncbi:MAG: NAD-dependent epimerase/dehydratase family protein [Actinomycetota bacterium]|nr:NAD-dependent epimerase/dehydratase family protein [Actinomycetota bacterium]MDA2971662.1 NAD-dependent epimerase/dehydratase family protein [Actinomycetota bacterium]MDA3000214.1 NAD-dependent epimerase/dehydratase family protein [Actinomycetota bacterium]